MCPFHSRCSVRAVGNIMLCNVICCSYVCSYVYAKITNRMDSCIYTESKRKKYKKVVALYVWYILCWVVGGNKSLTAACSVNAMVREESACMHVYHYHTDYISRLNHSLWNYPESNCLLQITLAQILVIRARVFAKLIPVMTVHRIVFAVIPRNNIFKYR